MLLYFDTNVYNYIERLDQSRQLRRLLRTTSHAVMVSMDVVLESARIQDTAQRKARLEVIRMMASNFPRRPKSYLESQELIQEIRRCRPGWFIARPNVKEINYYLRNYKFIMTAFLKSGSLELTEGFHEYVSQAERAIQLSKPYQKIIRASMVAGADVEFGADDPKWHGLIEHLPNIERHWRLQSNLIWYKALSGDPSMRDYHDWVAPHLDLAKISPEDWNLFWLRDVRAISLPRTRVRCLAEYHQSSVSVSHGNSIDINHATYLLDCDTFFTCDRQFHNVLTRVKGDINMQVAKPVLINSSERSAIDQFKEALCSLQPK